MPARKRIRERVIYGAGEIFDESGELLGTEYGVAVREGWDNDRPGMVDVGESVIFVMPADFKPDVDSVRVAMKFHADRIELGADRRDQLLPAPQIKEL